MHETNEVSAGMLHELREPIQAIRGFLAIVLAGRTGDLNATQRDFLQTANRAASRLDRLIRDLDVMRPLSAGVSLAPRKVMLDDSVEACIAELRPVASDLSVRMMVDARSPDKLGVYADPDRLDQILLNLLENALRYGSPGVPICIRLRGGRSRVLCVIENEIPVEVRNQNPVEWFRPFARYANDSGRACSSGRGLGLSVVNRLVETHSGRVLVRMTSDRVLLGFTLPRDICSPLATDGVRDELDDNWGSSRIHSLSF